MFVILLAAVGKDITTEEIKSGLPESEVSAPAGAEVKVAATSASPSNDKSDSGVEVSVAATSASPSNGKLDSAVLDSFPSPTETVHSGEAHETMNLEAYLKVIKYIPIE
nr:hypothetical protein [Tanacetum cinerariifolium]